METKITRMKKYTQKECDQMPVNEHGIKCYPTGDYSAISSFGEWCSFGECCSFGEWCSLESGKQLIGRHIYSSGGFGSEGRTTYGIPTKDGVFVRCGCWAGWLDDFRLRVAGTYSEDHEYMLVAKLFEKRWKSQTKETLWANDYTKSETLKG